MASESLKEQVRRVAREAGADIVGFGDMGRYEGAPKQMDPRYIFPEAKVMVGLGFRIPRGYLRGVEEGTHFYQYPAMGYANINEVAAPLVIRRVACFLEDHGHEGVALRNMGGNSPDSDFDGKREDPPDYVRSIQYSRPVRPGYPAPDVYVHFRIAAFVCGMGEIGFSKLFLTPEFGPRQRFAFLLTDADIEPDPIYDGPPLCDRCMQCVKECPGALTADETVKVTVAGRELEWSKLDEWHCAFAYGSGRGDVNPFLPPDLYDEIPDGRKIWSGEMKPKKEDIAKLCALAYAQYKRPGGYGPAICGGRGCIRACMVHLEKQGKLKNRFKLDFRQRQPWW